MKIFDILQILFRPRFEQQKLPGEQQNDVDLQPENKGAGGGDEFSEDSMASGSSGFGSLPRGKQRSSLVTSGTSTEDSSTSTSTTASQASTVAVPSITNTSMENILCSKHAATAIIPMHGYSPCC